MSTRVAQTKSSTTPNTTLPSIEKVADTILSFIYQRWASIFSFSLRSTIWTRVRIKYKFPTKRVKKYLTVIYTYVNFTLFYAGTALLNVLVFWISLDDKCKLLTSLFNALFVVVIMTIVYSKIPLILSTVPFIGKYYRSYCVNSHFAFITDIPARTTNARKHCIILF